MAGMDDYDLNSTNMTWPELEEMPDCSLCHTINTSNCYHTGNTTPEAMADPWSAVPELPYTLVVYVFCMLVGLLGNIAVITVMVREKGSRRNLDAWKTNMFLLSLSLSDLLLVMVAIPTHLLQYFSVQVDSSGAFCKISEYFRVLSATAAILNLTAVTIERFVVIVYPMQARFVCTLGNCRIVVFCVWGLSIFLAIPIILTKNVFTYFYANCTHIVSLTYCNDSDDSIGIYFTIYQLLVNFLVPGILMVACYSVVIRTLWRAQQNIAVMTNSIKTNKREKRKRFSKDQKIIVESSGGGRRQDAPVPRDARAERKQIIKMLLLVVALFLLCWGPRFLMETLLKMGFLEFTRSAYYYRVIFWLLPFVHAIINPLIYITMSKHFRTSLLKLLQCRAKEAQLDSSTVYSNYNRSFRENASPSLRLHTEECQTESAGLLPSPPSLAVPENGHQGDIKEVPERRRAASVSFSSPLLSGHRLRIPDWSQGEASD